MRLAAVVLAAAALCSSCAGDEPDRLELAFTVGVRSAQTRLTEIVDCEVRAAVCEVVSARRAALLPPQPKTLCAGGVPFATLHVSGRLDGEPVDRVFGNCEEAVTRRWIHLLEATVLEIHLVSSGRSHTMLLACSPTGGTVADPRAACRALDRDRRLFPQQRRGQCEPERIVTVYGDLRGSAFEQRHFLDCREPATVQAWTELLLGFHVPAAS